MLFRLCCGHAHIQALQTTTTTTTTTATAKTREDHTNNTKNDTANERSNGVTSQPIQHTTTTRSTAQQQTITMSKVATSARRFMSTAAKVDWSADVWKAAPIVANVNKFRSWVATADAQAEKYQTAPTPIDFDGAKSKIRDTELVDKIQAFYSSAALPAEGHEWDAEDKASKEAHFEQVKEQAALYQDLKDDIHKEIEFLKSTRTTEDTTIHDLMCNNPTIHEEIENEIENREWFKDIGLNAK
mmetsp:Transcript_19703/g.54792  ORF Transcript_19703/g.54792 Transcript_19703/m.54792 type:complete len:243 (-) Transcript_19703:179-907(-)